MATDRGEQHLPETADDEGGQVDRQEEGRPLDEVVPQAVRIETGQRADEREAPASCAAISSALPAKMVLAW